MTKCFEVLGNGPKALIAALEKNLNKKQLFGCGLAVGADEEGVNTIEIRQGTRMNGNTYDYIWIGHVDRTTEIKFGAGNHPALMDNG